MKIYYTISIALTLVLVIVGGIYWYQKLSPNSMISNQKELPIITTEVTNNESTRLFIDSLLNKLPDTYIISEIEYFESFDTEPQKAIKIAPCDENKFDPTHSPLCHTRLILLEQAKTDSLEEYIQTNEIMSWYEGALDANLIKATYQTNIPFVYTLNVFMCIGTGGDGCMRKRYVYHLEDGSNILAEISFMQFDKGELIEKPIQEVQDVINLYEKLLTE